MIAENQKEIIVALFETFAGKWGAVSRGFIDKHGNAQIVEFLDFAESLGWRLVAVDSFSYNALYIFRRNAP